MAASLSPEPPDSTLKRRARRRLVGAIAMVLAAVIVLPMIFDAERAPQGPDVSIQIPNQEALTVKPQPTLEAKPGAVEPVKPRAYDPGVPGVPGPPGVAKAPAKTAAVGEPRPADTPDPPSRLADKPAAKADARPVPDKVEEARVKALLDGKKLVASAPAETGDYAVQVGAFASDDKVREARDKLTGAGIKSFVEKLDTREGGRTRVRAGPFATREAAESARERVRGLGFPDAAVVGR